MGATHSAGVHFSGVMQLCLDFENSIAGRTNTIPRVQQRKPNHFRSGGLDRALTATAQDLALNVRSYQVGSRVTVWWNSRLQTTAGTADSGRYRIDLNPKLRTLGGHVVDRILRHELAHLVASDRYRDRYIAPHGTEWKRACEDLGIPGEKASHSLPLEGQSRQPRYAYRCPNCLLVVHRHRQMVRGSACVECCDNYNDGEYDEEFVFERVAATYQGT